MSKPFKTLKIQRSAIIGLAFLLQIAISNSLAIAGDYAPRVNKLLSDANELYNQGKYSSAKMQFNAALQLEPRCADAFNGLGLCCSKEGDLDTSSRCYKSALALKPDFYFSLYNLANNYYLQHNYSEAISLYMRAMAVAQKKNHKVDPDLLSSLASVYRDRAMAPGAITKDQDLTRAHQFYEKALSIDNNLPQAHAMLGRLYLDEKRFPQAEKELRAAISLKDDYSYAYYVLGRLYLQKKEYPAALVAYHNSLKYENVSSYKQDTASEMSQLGVPADISDHFARGYEAMNSGDWALAESEFEAVSGKDGTFAAVALNNLGYALARQKKFAEAIESYKKAIAANPHGQPEFYYNLGQAYLAQVSDVSVSGASASSNNSTNSAQGKAQLEHAEKAFNQCIIEARGNHFLAHNALGMVMKIRGELKESLNQYNIALMQSGGHLAVVQYNRGLVLEKLGRKDEARKSYEAYLKLSPSGLNADAAKQHLAQL